MSSLSIWVTGARGFIGRHLARTLASRGHRVCGIGHGAWVEAEAREWGIARWLNAEVRIANLQSLARNEAGTPQVLLHLAGGSSVGAAIEGPREDFGRTVVSAAELLEWLRSESPATHVITVSSAAVYGSAHSGSLPETTVCQPCSPYGFHKFMTEQLCSSYAATYGIRSTTVRLFSVYGAGLKKQLLWDLCSRLAAGADSLQLGGSGDELRDWTDVRDVTRALTLLAESLPGGSPLNVGSGVATSVRRIAELVVGAWPHRAAVTFSGRSRPGDPFSLVADASRLATLGFEWQVPVEQGIGDYVRWFLSQTKSVV